MACHLILEARRTGALELLLTTPLPTRTFLRGHFRALRGYFFWPIVAIAGLHVFYVYGTWSVSSGRLPAHVPYLAGYMLNAGCSFFSFLTDVVALCYVGTWLSLSLRRPALAILTTLLLVILLPYLLSQALPGLRNFAPSSLFHWLSQLPGLRRFSVAPYMLYPLARTLLWIGKNLLFYLWARRQLHRHFRAAAAQTYRWDRPFRRLRSAGVGQTSR